MTGMRNTGKKLGMYSEYYGWNFARTIWQAEDGSQYVRVNGMYIELGEAKRDCDSWSVLF